MVHHSQQHDAVAADGSRYTEHQHITAASAMPTHVAYLVICAQILQAKTKVVSLLFVT
jgi:hypothetical protein